MPVASVLQHVFSCIVLYNVNLQGHIGVDTAVFPENTPGFVLDAFARASLWKIGLDYRHGIPFLPLFLLVLKIIVLWMETRTSLKNSPEIPITVADYTLITVHGR